MSRAFPSPRALKRGLAAVALLAAASLAAEPSKSLGYLYVDASEGNSSGGHVALQFDGAVYHFQHVEPGLIQLFRENAGDFEYRYRYLENRNLEVSRITVSEDTFRSLRDHFEQRYQIQKRQFELFQALGHEIRLFRSLAEDGRDSEPAELPIPGAALFFEPQEPPFSANGNPPTARSPVLSALRQRVQARYGKDFIAGKIRAIDHKLRHLAPLRLNPGDFDPPTPDSVPSPDYTYYHRYRDLLTLRFALQALEETRRLRTGVYHAPKAGAFRLDDRQKAVLCRFQKTLSDGIVELLDSRRPDPGYALMVQMARLIVAARSCESGFLVFLDLFVDDAQAFSLAKLPQPPGFWRQLAKRQQAALQQNLTNLPKRALTETGYSVLETAANRYLELMSGITEKRPVRLFGLASLPDRTLNLSHPPPSDLSPATLLGASRRTREIRERYLDSLKRFYRYHLLSRNCVTEIFHTLEQGLARTLPPSAGPKAIREASVERLGGYVDPAMPNFIPFVSSRAVRRHYRVLSTRRLLSYRRERLESGEWKGLPARLREGNTVTATLYQFNGADSLFLFFTDDVILPRPLYGAANLLVAVLQSAAGLSLLPFDHGQTLQRGALGMVSSAVELAFFNIRKGSYRYLPPGEPGLIP